MKDTVQATAWVQVRAERGPGGAVIGARAVNLTQSRPQTTAPDARLVKVRLRLPVEAFEPLSAVIDVPVEAVQVPEIDGEVEQ